MKKGEIREGTIQKAEFPNKGLLETEDGEKVIVKNGIPGQKVRFRVQKKRKGKCEGQILEILEKSPIEQAEADCVHFGVCGGCTYQNLAYPQQLRLKEEQIKEMLSAVVKADDNSWFEGIKASPVQFGYRNKMEFSFGDECKGGDLTLGLHKRGSFYDIVPVKNCQIVNSDIRKILSTTVDYFASKEISFFHKITHEGYLRHLLVRGAAKTGEILVCLVTTSQLSMDLTEYRDLLLAGEYEGKIAGILHMVNDGLSDVVRADSTEVLYGRDYFYEDILGLKFKISPFSFFQTNSLGAEVLYEKAREYIGDVEGKVVFDLYSGTGTIAQVLAPVAKKVIGVEIVDEAVEAARENAAQNHLENCEFIAGDVLKVIDEIQEKPDVIVLDPPREGVHPKALKKILEYGVEQILYISCKPTSLARDMEMFLEQGYAPVRAECVDMFPWTRGVETVCVLGNKNRKPDDYLKVNIDVDKIHDILDQEKAEKEAKEKSQSK